MRYGTDHDHTLLLCQQQNTNRLEIAFSRFFPSPIYMVFWALGSACAYGCKLMLLTTPTDTQNGCSAFSFFFFCPVDFRSIAGMPTEIMPRQRSAVTPRKCVHVNFRSVNFTSFSGTHSLATILNPFEFFIH